MYSNFILGSGNLGSAIEESLRHKRNHTTNVYKGRQTKIEDFIKDVVEASNTKIVTVWNCEGYGSINECIKNPTEAFEVHVMRNVKMLEAFSDNPKIKLIAFSSNYVDQAPISIYSTTKKCMEQAFIAFRGRVDCYVYRVANLYGQYYPERSLPYKLYKAAKAGSKSFSTNILIPTDCDWLANIICNNSYSDHEETIVDISPRGATNAKLLVDSLGFSGSEGYIDIERPVTPTLMTDEDDLWSDVWQKSELYDLIQKEMGK